MRHRTEVARPRAPAQPRQQRLALGRLQDRPRVSQSHAGMAGRHRVEAAQHHERVLHGPDSTGEQYEHLVRRQLPLGRLGRVVVTLEPHGLRDLDHARGDLGQRRGEQGGDRSMEDHDGSGAGQHPSHGLAAIGRPQVVVDVGAGERDEVRHPEPPGEVDGQRPRAPRVERVHQPRALRHDAAEHLLLFERRRVPHAGADAAPGQAMLEPLDGDGVAARRRGRGRGQDRDRGGQRRRPSTS